MEKQQDRVSDAGLYWTRSKSRKAALVGLIAIGFLVVLYGIYNPDVSKVDNIATNYTIQEGNIQRDIFESTTRQESSNFGQLSLAIIIGILIVILWPTIRSVKVGTSSFEIEKLTYTEVKG